MAFLPLLTSSLLTKFGIILFLYSTSAGGKDLSNYAQIREFGLIEPEIGTKMLKKMSEKLRAKFPATTRGYSMVKMALLDDAFLRRFLTASKPSRRSITEAKEKKKTRKMKGEKKIKT